MGRNFSEMKDEELIEMAEGLHDMIYQVECYGVRDMHNYEGSLIELEKRGYEIHEEKTLHIRPKEGHVKVSKMRPRNRDSVQAFNQKVAETERR